MTSTALAAYRAATWCAGPGLRLLARLRARSGKEDPTRLGERRGLPSQPRPEGRLVWIHAASMGEANCAVALAKGLGQTTPGLSALLTTATTAAAAVHGPRFAPYGAHQYVPWDNPVWTRRFVRAWRPDLAIWVESELWPNLLLDVKASGARMALVNGRMSARAFRRWSRASHTARTLLGLFDTRLAQSALDAERLSTLAHAETPYVGNLKHDAPAPEADPATLAALRARLGGRPTWLALSAHPGEIDALLAARQAVLARVPNLATIVAPRHPNKAQAFLDAFAARGLAGCRRAEAMAWCPEKAILLADSLGETDLWCALADAVFVGGSLIPHGGQSPLDAARRAKPVLVGPHRANFAQMYDRLLDDAAALGEAAAWATPDAAALGEAAAWATPDAAALGEALATLLTDAALRARMGQAGQRAAQDGVGALSRTLAKLTPLLAAS